jgi:hypothetical protein
MNLKMIFNKAILSIVSRRITCLVAIWFGCLVVTWLEGGKSYVRRLTAKMVIVGVIDLLSNTFICFSKSMAVLIKGRMLYSLHHHRSDNFPIVAKFKNRSPDDRLAGPYSYYVLVPP